jgi:hypothetical protein
LEFNSKALSFFGKKRANSFSQMTSMWIKIMKEKWEMDPNKQNSTMTTLIHCTMMSPSKLAPKKSSFSSIFKQNHEKAENSFHKTCVCA